MGSDSAAGMDRLLDSLPAALVVADAGHRIRAWNPEATRITSISAEAAIGSRIEDCLDIVTRYRMDPSGAPVAATALQIETALRGSGAWTGRLDIRAHGGAIVTCDAEARAIAGPDGPSTEVLWLLRDVTGHERLRAQHDVQRRLAQTVLDVASTMTLVLDRRLRIVMANASWFRGATELGDAPMLGDDLRRLALGSALVAHASAPARTLADEIESMIEGGVQATEVDVEAVDAKGAVRNFSAQLVRILDGHRDDSSPVIVVVMTDISTRRSLERALAHQANHDPLTGLPNRALLEEELGRALGRAGRSGRRVAIVFCDLDGFKPVNDELGHQVGDSVLREVADRLVHASRVSDMVARIGGDEFVVLAEDVDDAAELLPLTERLLAGVRHPIRTGGHEIPVGMSIGLAVSGDGGDSPDTLLARADLAMYAAKESGGGRVEIYLPNLHGRLRGSLDGGPEALRRAVDDDALRVFMQPVVGREPVLISIECLVRWAHPALGLLGPGAILGLPGASGSLADLDAWVLDQAVAAAREWDHLLGESAYISVNVTGRLAAAPEWADSVREALRKAGVSPARLGMEVTLESLAQEPAAAAALSGLARDGVRIVIDDFGGGRGALAQAGAVPLAAAKLDSSLTDRLDLRPNAQRLLRATVAFCHAYGVDAIAKGVSGAGALAMAREAGCDGFQGFTVMRPAPPGDIEEWLENARRNPEWLSTW